MTHRDEEKHAGGHGCESGAAAKARPRVAAEADDDTTKCGDDGEVVRYVERDNLGRRVRSAREGDHHRQLDAAHALQVRQRRARCVDRYEE